MFMTRTRVFLADDHDVVRAGIRSVLEDQPDLEIVGESGDGRTLLESIARLAPDLLVVDVAMPDFAPVPTLRAIRDRYPSLKILVNSAHDDDVYVKGLLQLGVHGYHLKDLPLADLVLAVRRVAAGERWLPEPIIAKLSAFDEVATSFSVLTMRQIELLRLLQEGLDNQGIAGRTGLSIKTVENHLTRLYRVLNVQSRLEAVKYAAQHPAVVAMPGRFAAQSMGPAALTAQAQSLDRQPVILVVDDNPRYRQKLQRSIGRLYPHAALFDASTIDEALQVVRRVATRLVLLDVVLGEESGIACARRIKAISPSSRIVLLSAYPDREFHRLGLAAGALAFVDKSDLDGPALSQIIDDVMAADV